MVRPRMPGGVGGTARKGLPIPISLSLLISPGMNPGALWSFLVKVPVLYWAFLGPLMVCASLPQLIMEKEQELFMALVMVGFQVLFLGVFIFLGSKVAGFILSMVLRVFKVEAPYPKMADGFLISYLYYYKLLPAFVLNIVLALIPATQMVAIGFAFFLTIVGALWSLKHMVDCMVIALNRPFWPCLGYLLVALILPMIMITIVAIMLTVIASIFLGVNAG